jgi:GDP-L-fucose synthase
MFYKGKKVLVTGGTGLIGQPLVRMLIEQGAQVRIASLDDPALANPRAEFKRTNLMRFENCLEVCQGMNLVFNLVGIKGSPGVTTKKVASVFVPNLMFNTNMMEAARQAEVSWYLFTSTVGVYAQAEVFIEDEMWKKPPGENDKFAGWAKRMGELQAEAYTIEYGWKRVSIVRPANVYGPHDNFDPRNAMVVPSLIRRALEGEDPFVVWGDGSPIRDFIHAEDVARGMMLAVEKGVTDPMNLGSGTGITIKELVDIIVSHLPKKPKVIWDTTKPSGDRKRLMDITRARQYGFEPQITFEQGIPSVMNWYLENRTATDKRYNVFTTGKLI